MVYMWEKKKNQIQQNPRYACDAICLQPKPLRWGPKSKASTAAITGLIVQGGGVMAGTAWQLRVELKDQKKRTILDSSYIFLEFWYDIIDLWSQEISTETTTGRKLKQLTVNRKAPKRVLQQRIAEVHRPSQCDMSFWPHHWSTLRPCANVVPRDLIYMEVVFLKNTGKQT